MKITKLQLRQIIKEELAAVLAEQVPGSDASVNKAKVVNQTRDRLRKKIQTLPGLGGRADLPFPLQEAIAKEIFRLSGGDSKKCLSMADAVGDTIVKLSKSDIKDGKLDQRVLIELSKGILKQLKGMPKSKKSKRPAPASKPGGSGGDKGGKTSTSVTQGTLEGTRITKTRRDGKDFVVTVCNKDNVCAAGRVKYRGSISGARDAAAGRARDELLKKLQGK